MPDGRSFKEQLLLLFLVSAKDVPEKNLKSEFYNNRYYKGLSESAFSCPLPGIVRIRN